MNRITSKTAKLQNVFTAKNNSSLKTLKGHLVGTSSRNGSTFPLIKLTETKGHLFGTLYFKAHIFNHHNSLN